MNMKRSNPESVEALPTWKIVLKNWYKPYPWLELFVLCSAALVFYVGWLLITVSLKGPPDAISPFSVYAWVAGLFFVSLVIGFVGTLAGIGGGVIWSPIAMAFTPMNSVIIRAAGLVIAMFNALVATGPLARTGLCNIRLGLFLMIPLGVGAFLGAQGAIFVAKSFGVVGEGIIRIILALIIFGLFLYFLLGGKKIEYPEVKKEDAFTLFFKMHLPYYEPSEGKVIDYKLNRGLLFWVAIFFVGLIGGFFGMGGGWAVVPALNVIMGVPLKVAAAVSMTGLGMGSCVSVWPYFIAGAMIPLVIAPLLVGQVLGGVLGAQVLIGMRAVFVRFILIGTLLFTSFGLLTKGLDLLGVLKLPISIRLGFMVVCVGLVLYLIAKDYNWLGLGKGRR
jgi:uncharacterized membrane protein YfcA